MYKDWRQFSGRLRRHKWDCTRYGATINKGKIENLLGGACLQNFPKY
jgi:hypothetical protein